MNYLINTGSIREVRYMAVRDDLSLRGRRAGSWREFAWVNVAGR